MNATDLLTNVSDWVFSNLNNILFISIAVILGYLVFKIISTQIRKLESLEEHLTYTLNRITKWIISLIVIFAILGHFNITLGTVSGALALFGGTLLGFASINTFGNALAGLIVMFSRPFSVGDRIIFKNQLADVIGIELIYTKLRTLDNSIISVPSQELLTSQIENYGKKGLLRRRLKITPGYEYNSNTVKKVLLDAASNMEGILKKPAPFVRITNFLDYAVEYTLYVYINQIQKCIWFHLGKYKKKFQ